VRDRIRDATAVEKLVVTFGMTLVLISLLAVATVRGRVEADQKGCTRQNQTTLNQYALEELFLAFTRHPIVKPPPEEAAQRAAFLNQFSALHRATFEKTREFAANPHLPPTDPRSVEIDCKRAYPPPWPGFLY